tara:strand:+ start:2274 stop:2546 length:273 start_codon:yes stop_codon:yes gene_type:complete
MMDLALIDQYGLPIAMVVFFGYYIWRQTMWIQKELEGDMESSFQRLENIVIELISQQKKTQLELSEIKGYIGGIEKIITRLSGNGLRKDK